VLIANSYYYIKLSFIIKKTILQPIIVRSLPWSVMNIRPPGRRRWPRWSGN